MKIYRAFTVDEGALRSDTDYGLFTSFALASEKVVPHYDRVDQIRITEYEFDEEASEFKQIDEYIKSSMEGVPLEGRWINLDEYFKHY